ncbi:unnamed protein product, partial [Discosporangium mesarthrocarpum]
MPSLPVIAGGRRKRTVSSRGIVSGGLGGATSYPSLVDEGQELLPHPAPASGSLPSSNPPSFDPGRSSGVSNVGGGSSGVRGGVEHGISQLKNQTSSSSSATPRPFASLSPREVTLLATFTAEWYVTYALYHLSVDALSATATHLEYPEGGGGAVQKVSGDVPASFVEASAGGVGSGGLGGASYVSVSAWQSVVALAVGFILSRSQALAPRRIEARPLTEKEEASRTQFLWVLAAAQLLGTGLEYKSYALSGPLAAESLRATETAFYLLISVALGQQRLSLTAIPILLLSLGMALSSLPAAAGGGGEPG